MGSILGDLLWNFGLEHLDKGNGKKKKRHPGKQGSAVKINYYYNRPQLRADEVEFIKQQYKKHYGFKK